MNRRALLLFLIFSVLFFTLAYRFFVIQITGQAEGKVLASYADEKYFKTRSIEASRGSILDRNGEIIAADTIAYKLIAILDPSVTPKNASTPNHVADAEKTAAILSEYIDLDQSKIYERLKLADEGYFQVEFGEAGRNLSYETKTKIEELNLPGITFVREPKRSYPNGIFASHLIGYASKDPDTRDFKLTGQIGLEKTLNSYLEGKDGKINYKSDRWGFILPDGDEIVTKPKNGDNVHLTIDKKIQTFLEEAMTEVDESYAPKKMMAVVADAKTGAILAMAQRPTFDPNTREGIQDNWQNIVVESAFEPGSTMKVFTLASAIEEGVFNPNGTFVSGKFEVKGSQPIRDHNHIGWGEITFLEGIQKSSNVAISYLVQKMGTETFRNYLDKFHFGQPTEIGLPNESSGKMQYQWERDKYATAYGQATSVTALQMIQAMTAITNDGNMMKPYVIDRIADSEGKVVKDFKNQPIGKPVSADTAKKTREILETTVTEEGATGNRFNIEGYRIAGKTGTAQIYQSGTGYLKGWDNYIFSFIGFAPVDDPELIMFVMVQQPDLNDAEYEAGSVPVSKIFNPVMKNSLQYLNIKPDEGIETAKARKLPNLLGLSVKDAKKELEKLNLSPVIIGNGKSVLEQLPLEGTDLLEKERVMIKTDGKMTLPDLKNWSLREVFHFSNLTGISLSFSGSGFVVSQNLEPGTVISKESKLSVELKDPLEIVSKNMEKETE